MSLQKALSNFKRPPQVVVDSHLINHAETLVDELHAGDSYAIICDHNTRPMLHGRFEKAHWLELEEPVAADIETVERIHKETEEAGLLIALGSGTINDLCKYAAFLAHKPYVVFSTAPSMNGYLSANASITVNGHKKSLTAHTPLAVFCDLVILCSAPDRLIKSGLGDSICRSTCQADWLLSHLLLDTPYDPLPFKWLKYYEKKLLKKADALLESNHEAMRVLINTLLVSGLGMLHTGGSYPASEGEHLIAHTMEMQYGDALPPSYHGEQIAITTLTMIKRQQDILNSNAPPVLQMQLEGDEYKKRVTSYFGSKLSPAVIREYEAKLEVIRSAKATEILKKNWKDIRKTIAEVTLDQQVIEKVLLKAECSIKAKDIGWPEKKYQHAMKHAHFMRNRFTFLDIAD